MNLCCALFNELYWTIILKTHHWGWYHAKKCCGHNTLFNVIFSIVYFWKILIKNNWNEVYTYIFFFLSDCLPAKRLTTHENVDVFFLVIYEMGDYVIWVSENPLPNTFKINLTSAKWDLALIIPKNIHTYIFSID